MAINSLLTDSSYERPRDLRDELRFHVAVGYYLKRNVVFFFIVYLWVMTAAGIYSYDLAVLTPILLSAIAAWAILRRQYERFRNKQLYFFSVTVIDNFTITAAVYVMGGAGSAAVSTLYILPMAYHSVRRSRFYNYLVANTAGVMYAIMMALEGSHVIPYQSPLGFNQPPAMTYVGMVFGLFVMLNFAAMAFDAVKAPFERTIQRLWQLSAETEFIASAISHELKNPLSAATNAADLLIAEADTVKPQDVRELGTIVRHSVTKAYDMLTHLRQLLIAVNKQERSQAIPLQPLIESLLRDMSASGTLNGSEAHIPTQLPVVHGQPQKLEQVFRNLLMNAVEHGHVRPKGVVALEYLGADASRGFGRFAVSDSGPGIPVEHRDRIFDPFVTLGDTVSEGRGLGLALVKRVIRDAGGRIWVEDAAGGGARFVFTLPTAE